MSYYNQPPLMGMSSYHSKIVDCTTPILFPKAIIADVEPPQKDKQERGIRRTLDAGIKKTLDFMKKSGINTTIIHCDYEIETQSDIYNAINEMLNEKCLEHDGKLFALATLPYKVIADKTTDMGYLSTLPYIKGYSLNCSEIMSELKKDDLCEMLCTASEVKLPIVLNTSTFKHEEQSNQVKGKESALSTAKNNTAQRSHDISPPITAAKAVFKLIRNGCLDSAPNVKLVVHDDKFFLPELFRLSARCDDTEQEEDLQHYLRSNIYLTTAPSSKTYLMYLLDIFGLNRVMLSSVDEASLKKTLSDIDGHEMSQHDKQKFCGVNAASCYKLDEQVIVRELNMSKITIIRSRAVELLSSKLRDKRTAAKEFTIYGDRLMNMLVEEALARIPSVKKSEIETPTSAHKYSGLVDEGSELCVVSIMRSGDIPMEAVRRLVPGIRVGKILIQRDEKTADKRPIYYYNKLPSDIGKCQVLLVDPMVGTAGSALCAMDCLVENDVEPQNIMFVCLFSNEEGLEKIQTMYPPIDIITLSIDEYMNEDKYLVPGIGDFGDRYYSTTH